MNVGVGPEAAQFLFWGIFVSNFRYSIFAVFPIVATMLKLLSTIFKPFRKAMMLIPLSPFPVFCRASLSSPPEL